MEKVTDQLWSWAGDVDENTMGQALRTSRLPIVAGHVALMADAHFGLGATIGSVVPTEGALIPAAVGVDIGCGMVALRTPLTADDLPDDLHPALRAIERAIPAGVGRGHRDVEGERAERLEAIGLPPGTEIDARQRKKLAEQFGSLGSGNHFVEVSLDGMSRVWLVLHSGSRGIGNELATHHIEASRAIARASRLALEDPDLAYLLQGSPEFESYVADLEWAQRYAFENREVMATASLRALYRAIGWTGPGEPVELVNCHHNYATREIHGGRELWVTRKGAIRARLGDRGVVPGSMGTATFIVRGLGNPAAYDSSSHGAGRRLSRHAARRQVTARELAAAMGSRAWLDKRARTLVDEAPQAYKNIEEVMAAQADLVEVEDRLDQVLNYKGT